MALKILIFFAAVAMASVRSGWIGPVSYERTEEGNAIDKASMKMLKEAYGLASDKNVVSSPLGVMLLLSLYSSGAGDKSRQEISAFLSNTDVSKIQTLSQKFANMDPSFFTLANKIYVAKGYTLTDTFSNTARQAYNSEVENLDFTDVQAAADVINRWGDEKTRGNIKEAVTKDVLDKEAAAALFNVIFFKGHWHVPFNASETKDKDFHTADSKTVKKPTMHLQQSLYYHDSKKLGARMVELPYKEPGFRMVIILPNEVDGLQSVLDKAAEEGVLEEVFKLSPAGAQVELDLPKFDINTALDLNDVLPKVGVSQIFHEGTTGIVNERGVRVSKAFQKAFIKVDEEGATAGAFTGFVSVARSLIRRIQRNIIFKVDHPFLFTILHGDKIIFAGTSTN